MVGRKKKTKICDKGLHEDRLSQLPESLISEILCHLSTKDAARTSVLSTKWKNLWQWIPDLDLCSSTFSNSDAFVSFVERFFSSHRESWIRKLRLSFGYGHGMCDLMSWIDVATRHKIQHLDVSSFRANKISMILYRCETLVHLRLCEVTLCNAEFVSLPCLKIMHLRYTKYLDETTLQKLISGAPILEDLMIMGPSNDVGKTNVLQVRSHTLKRIYIDEFTQVVIDAPILQCLKATISSPKNIQIVNLGFSLKLDIHFGFSHTRYSSSMIHDILNDISRVRDLVITNAILKEIFLYSKSEPILQFRDLSRLSIRLSKSDLDTLPTILESCPKLESFILELFKNFSICRKKKKEPKVMFSTVPQCLVSSLKFVELKRSLLGKYEGEIELIRYFLKNSTILKKLRLNVYYPKNAKCAFLEELVAIPRCSSACEVRCSFVDKQCCCP